MKVEKLELIVFERSRLSTVSEPDELRIELNVKEVSRLMNSRHDKYLSQNAGQWENAITDLKMREQHKIPLLSFFLPSSDVGKHAILRLINDRSRIAAP